MVLDDAGFEVLTFDTPNLALELMKSHRVDMILLDIALPQMTGVQILRKIKEEHSHQPLIVMLTRKKTKEDVTASIDLGANDYIVKPIGTPEDFLKRIDKNIQKLTLPKIVQCHYPAELEASSADGFDLKDPIVTTGEIFWVSLNGFAVLSELPIERGLRLKIKSPLLSEMNVPTPSLYLKVVAQKPSKKKFEIVASTINIQNESIMTRIQNWIETRA